MSIDSIQAIPVFHSKSQVFILHPPYPLLANRGYIIPAARAKAESNQDTHILTTFFLTQKKRLIRFKKGDYMNINGSYSRV